MLSCLKKETREVKELVKSNPGLMSINQYLLVLFSDRIKT